MSTPLSENEIIDRVIDLSDLAADLYNHEEDHLRTRILSLIDLIKSKINLLTLSDGRKAKKFKETQALIEKQFSEVISTIVTKCRALMKDVATTSMGVVFGDYNPLWKRRDDTAIRNTYKELLELTERLSILLHKLEG